MRTLTYRSPCSLFSSSVRVLVILLFAGVFLTTGPTSSGKFPQIISSKVAPPGPAPDLSDTALSRGKFLVASREMRDPRFLETVILIVDYGPDGAMGLVINRPTTTKLSKAFPDVKGLKTRSDVFYVGGPVRMDQVFLLIRSDSGYEDSRNVFRDVYVSVSMTALQRIIDKGETAKRFRVFAGYAGWGARQLDMEVALGGWHVIPADTETIFEKEPARVWPELIRRSSLKWIKDWSVPSLPANGSYGTPLQQERVYSLLSLLPDDVHHSLFGEHFLMEPAIMAKNFLLRDG